MKKDNPVVSVVMITYGHEKYVEQAINGIFIQQTDFPVELIIANDNSPDDSDEAIKKVISNAPANITVHYTKHEQNKGMITNFVWALQQASGKYIALCEGDDYWIDNLKIQKQVSFLEENPDYFGCQHGRIVLNDKGEEKVENYFGHIFTQCVVFRNKLSQDFFKTLEDSKILNADVMLEHYLKSNGKFKYFDFLGAVYRFNGSGVFSSLKVKERQKEGLRSAVTIIDFLKKSEFPLKNKQIKELQKQYLELYYALLQSGEKPYNLQDYLKKIFTFKEFNKLEFLKIASYISRTYIKQGK